MQSAHTYSLPNAGGRTVPTDSLIAGRWQDASGRPRLDVLTPACGEILTSVANAGLAEGLRAVAAAQLAARDWARTATRKRSELLSRCFDIIVANAEWLAQLISLENGKALADAKSYVLYEAEFFRWYAQEAVRNDGELNFAPGGSNRILVQYQPMGVSLLITPWNFPAAMATRKIAPALAAGCTCVLKPAEQTPLTALAIADLMLEAGIPAGVVYVITTREPGPLVSAFLHDRRVRKLSFTGSTGVGRLLLREASDQVIICSMELGGNAPFIVLADADLTAALDGAMIAKCAMAAKRAPRPIGSTFNAVFIKNSPRPWSSACVPSRWDPALPPTPAVVLSST